MPIKKCLFIIGISLWISFSVQTKSACALYSPRLSQQVAIIREHMESSQMENGHGSVLGEIEYFKNYDKNEIAQGSETGISGNAQVAQDLVFDTTYWQQLQNPFDSLMMAFQFNAFTGEFISPCLRDEIWQLEALRDAVGQEMIKAYMLRDIYHGDLLTEDYTYLVAQLDLLRKYGSQPNYYINAQTVEGQAITLTSNEYFFGTKPTGDDATNYYISVFPRTSEQIGCPSSEWDQAFEQVGRSWKTLSVLASGGGAEWGNIWTMAKANARIRAQQWLRANQISLTLGGETGAQPQSLVKGGGWEKFVGNVKTQWKILENMIGPVTPLWNLAKWTVTSRDTHISECVIYSPDDDKFRNCNPEQREQYLLCKNDPIAAEAAPHNIRCDRFRNTEEIKSYAEKAGQQVALEDIRQNTINETKEAFVYHITLENVAEQNIYAIDTALWDMNGQIRRGYENVDANAGKGIPTLTDKLATFADKQCMNKQQ